ncbi:hypothetical protein [Mycolicibacterium sp. A43C]
MTDAIVISVFVGLLLATLVFGAWLGRRSERARRATRHPVTWEQRIRSGLAPPPPRPSLPNIADEEHR